MPLVLLLKHYAGPVKRQDMCDELAPLGEAVGNISRKWNGAKDPDDKAADRNIYGGFDPVNDSISATYPYDGRK